jgi:uncharacterized membrane protein
MTDGRRSELGPERDNLAAISDMEARGLDERSRGERLSDAVSNLASTPEFAISHVIFFAAWILTQSGAVPLLPQFDPYPFTFLTLVVSLEAIFLSVFVLISQHRLTRQAEQRSHLDLQINMLAEQESTSALRLLYAIARHLDVSDLPDEESLAADTSVSDLIRGVRNVTD